VRGAGRELKPAHGARLTVQGGYMVNGLAVKRRTKYPEFIRQNLLPLAFIL
jgi:hypothetical protein